jgi:predicted DNA-binding protein
MPAQVMYDVWTMRRTNIYLDDEQLASLRGLSERRGEPVATLVREAIDAWLAAQGVRRIPDDEWQRRVSALLERRARVADERGFSQDEVERDAIEAVREVRKARTARRS